MLTITKSTQYDVMTRTWATLRLAVILLQLHMTCCIYHSKHASPDCDIIAANLSQHIQEPCWQVIKQYAHTVAQLSFAPVKFAAENMANSIYFCKLKLTHGLLYIIHKLSISAEAISVPCQPDLARRNICWAHQQGH